MWICVFCNLIKIANPCEQITSYVASLHLVWLGRALPSTWCWVMLSLLAAAQLSISLQNGRLHCGVHHCLLVPVTVVKCVNGVSSNTANVQTLPLPFLVAPAHGTIFVIPEIVVTKFQHGHQSLLMNIIIVIFCLCNTIQYKIDKVKNIIIVIFCLCNTIQYKIDKVKTLLYDKTERQGVHLHLPLKVKS